MIRPPLHPLASWRRVLGAEFRAVGLALRPVLTVAGVLGAVIALISGFAALRDGEGIAFDLTYALLSTLVACLLPVAVWRGEYRVRRSYLASLPVDRGRHVLAKVAAGWGWVLVLTAAFMLGMLLLALATGGTIGVDSMRVMLRDLPGGVLPEGDLPADVATLARRWTTPGWQWATFFTGATVAYLVGSAVVLSGSRAWRWLGGLVVLVVFFAFLAEQGFQFGRTGNWIVGGLERVVVGRHGFARLFAVGDDGLFRTTTGEEVRVWGDPPTPGAWALTTLLWMGLALVGVLVAARREREG